MPRAQAEQLAVWMEGRHVATLARAKGRLSLQYTTTALQTYDLNTPLLSISLPLGPRAFSHAKTHPFFDGLLPEGEARRMLAYDFRLEMEDTFGLLSILGRDCAGALVLLPQGDLPPGADVTAPTVLTNEEVAARLRQLSVEPLGVGSQVRVSLAGVQQKMVLTRLATGEWALPIDGLPSTHILKRADPRFAHMVANEAFCLAVARHLGLAVAAAEIIQIPEPILVVTRYDREVGPDGRIRRLHQEDLAQAFGLNASAKYEEHGGPSLRAIARLLRDWTRDASTLERLLELTLLNMVIGNADAHAKNFSLLHSGAGAIQLAPAYDLMSTVYYPGVDTRPGMYINQKRSIHDVTATDVLAEAEAWGLDRDHAAGRVHRLFEGFPAAISRACAEIDTVPRALVDLVSARAAAFTADFDHR